MEGGFDHLSDVELLGVIDACLDVLGRDRLQLLSGAAALDLLAGALRTGGRLQTWQSSLAARLEADATAWTEHGTSTATWLAEAVNLTRTQAARLIASGQGLARFDVVREAAASGQVLPEQGTAITSVLAELPDDLPTDAVERAQATMVELAASHNSTELRRLTRHLLEVVDPDGVEAREASRLSEQLRRATRNRFLKFSYDHQGSVLFRGSLPIAQAEPLIKIIDACTAKAKRGLDRLDPLAEYLTPAMWRADALVAMVAAHQQQALAPSHGGDRPRIAITISYDKLLQAGTDAGLLAGRLLGDGEALSAGVLRQCLCDADVLPVVLGGASQILDVGRSQRLVTPEIRLALELRDGGCVFPGCDKPARDCHAHHLVPWWAGGSTSLENLVLVCAHHHGIVEPGRNGEDRWYARLRPDGVAEIVPPKRVDREQRPRVHARFITRRRT